MSKKLTQILFFLFALLIYLMIGQQVSAASFTFDKTTVSVAVDSTFQLTITENAGTDQTNSSQVYIIYDPTLLEAEIVTAGTYFPTVSNNITLGKVFIVGYVDGTTLYKTGSGTLATITFKGLKDGTGTITVDCRPGVSDSSQIIKYNDANATNLITCSDNNSVAVTVGTGASLDSSAAGTSEESALPTAGIMDYFNQTSVIGAGLMILGVILRLAL